MAKTKRHSKTNESFATLEPRIHHVSKAAIRKKWKKLPESTQERVHSLFQSVERSAAVINGKEKKAGEAQAMIRQVMDNLSTKLPRMPFPQGTQDVSFDYESMLKRNSDLQSHLTANIHSKNLLKAEIEKEEGRLAEDREELLNLERGLKDARAVRKRQNKRLHPLVCTIKPTREEFLEPTIENYDATKPQHASLNSLEGDTDVAPLLHQLRDHLESLQNNTASTRAIVSAIETSQAGLDVFISQRLDHGTQIRLLGLEAS